MIKNNLKMILADREISINKLSEMTGLRYATLHAFVKQRVSSINCEVLDKVCEALNLTPADFIIYVKNLRINKHIFIIFI